jgi:hypothetical protein
MGGPDCPFSQYAIAFKKNKQRARIQIKQIGKDRPLLFFNDFDGPYLARYLKAWRQSFLQNRIFPSEYGYCLLRIAIPSQHD